MLTTPYEVNIKETEAQGVNSPRVKHKVAKPFHTQVSDTKVQDPSMDLILFLKFSFKKESEIKTLKDPKMEHAGRTQKFCACFGGDPERT